MLLTWLRPLRLLWLPSHASISLRNKKDALGRELYGFGERGVVPTETPKGWNAYSEKIRRSLRVSSFILLILILMTENLKLRNNYRPKGLFQIIPF